MSLYQQYLDNRRSLAVITLFIGGLMLAPTIIFGEENDGVAIGLGAFNGVLLGTGVLTVLHLTLDAAIRAFPRDGGDDALPILNTPSSPQFCCC